MKWVDCISALMVLVLLPYSPLENSVDSYQGPNMPLQQYGQYDDTQEGPDSKLDKITEAVTAEIWKLSRQYFQEIQPAYVAMAASYISNQQRHLENSQKGHLNPPQRQQRQPDMGHRAPSNDDARNNGAGYQDLLIQNTQGGLSPTSKMKPPNRKLVRRESPKKANRLDYKEGWY